MAFKPMSIVLEHQLSLTTRTKLPLDQVPLETHLTMPFGRLQEDILILEITKLPS